MPIHGARQEQVSLLLHRWVMDSPVDDGEQLGTCDDFGWCHPARKACGQPVTV